uniref:Uncharacterized protein n=1 Tax=Meloidogyne enterolobii TaxID=390850 RepID=A0A6V7V2J9_MELEN|nr:unnamed protein product [Meloidogyne enterolobii]
MDNNQQQQPEIENKEKESPKDSGKKKVKFETSSDSSGDDFEMVQSAKNDGVIKNDAQAKRFEVYGKNLVKIPLQPLHLIQSTSAGEF